MNIYHGTSLRIWRKIKDCGYLNPAPQGDMHVSFSCCSMVAARFALNAYQIGEFEGEDDGVGLVVLRAWVPKLERYGLKLFPYSSPVWGEGECDWEREIACSEPVPINLLESPVIFGPIFQNSKIKEVSL